MRITHTNIINRYVSATHIRTTHTWSLTQTHTQTGPSVTNLVFVPLGWSSESKLIQHCASHLTVMNVVNYVCVCVVVQTIMENTLTASLTFRSKFVVHTDRRSEMEPCEGARRIGNITTTQQQTNPAQHAMPNMWHTDTDDMERWHGHRQISMDDCQLLGNDDYRRLLTTTSIPLLLPTQPVKTEKDKKTYDDDNTTTMAAAQTVNRMIHNGQVDSKQMVLI